MRAALPFVEVREAILHLRQMRVTEVKYPVQGLQCSLFLTSLTSNIEIRINNVSHLAMTPHPRAVLGKGQLWNLGNQRLHTYVLGFITFNFTVSCFINLRDLNKKLISFMVAVNPDKI